MQEWNQLVDSLEELEKLPNRLSVNPLNGEEIVFSGEGKAMYRQNGEVAGNASLESGVVLTTGIPISYCQLIADWAKLSAMKLQGFSTSALFSRDFGPLDETPG